MVIIYTLLHNSTHKDTAMENDQKTSASTYVAPVGPYVTKELYSQLTGLTLDTIRGMVERGHVPTKKFGKQRLINLLALQREASEQEYED